jgi:hypothetical protein
MLKFHIKELCLMRAVRPRFIRNFDFNYAEHCRTTYRHKGGHVHGKQETRFHRNIALGGMRGAIEPHHGALMKQV